MAAGLECGLKGARSMTWAEWISVNSSAIAAFLSVIATALAAVATWRGPIAAAQMAEDLRRQNDNINETARLRKWIFFTLMQERATLTSQSSVQALNSIDVVFADDTKVREAWADLYHHYGTPNANTQVGEQKVRDLLRQMAAALGLSEVLRRDDFSRVYYPNAMADEHYVQALQRIAIKNQLEGQLRSPVANTAPQISETAEL
jgi:hypothetical protein